MVKKMSRKEIEEAMEFEMQVQEDVNYIPSDEETEEQNWEEYLRKQQEKENTDDSMIEDWEDSLWQDDVYDPYWIDDQPI